MNTTPVQVDPGAPFVLRLETKNGAWYFQEIIPDPKRGVTSKARWFHDKKAKSVRKFNNQDEAREIIKILPTMSEDKLTVEPLRLKEQDGQLCAFAEGIEVPEVMCQP